MNLISSYITGIKVLDTAEESAQAIETMVNKAIAEARSNGFDILDLQMSDNNIVLVLGKNKE
ncbi:MAG: hypothetical protein G3M78_11195 [Candidatus Nitrohelix vancouverensis]|uniref:Uncharacterized protein n=1 Tax=Candidatus Nitrohelix vancouverensis TaxID=2705534 RepID=A0A7T0C3M1_9BACT|nr:MAG: hypothetical protein G3M78_11195 [Candidatus Nitrohelix vancouverensis]